MKPPNQTFTPSPSQREAIEAPIGPLLVLAGPGAGKTFCLIERIGYLIERLTVDPARICAFTFTNKAAGEITHRLEMRFGDAASRIKRGTIHAFCAELLREAGSLVGVEAGFGIADETYQINVLRRLKVKAEFCKSTLTRFSAYRFSRTPLHPNDIPIFNAYEAFLTRQRVLDYDALILTAADLLEMPQANTSRARWDVVLVDEFQDLNPVQYRVVKALANDHRHVFAVGDHEQSIYSWTGADPRVFSTFANDFEIAGKRRVQLGENRRCPRDVFDLARRLVTNNPPLFPDQLPPLAERLSTFPIDAQLFTSDTEEQDWLIGDIRRDRDQFNHRWGDVALLYRTNQMGNALETAFLNAGIPCRLSQGKALSEDPVAAHVIAAIRVIANPGNDIHRDEFLRHVLPKSLFEEERAQAQSANHDLVRQLEHRMRRLPRGDARRGTIKRAVVDVRNLAALGNRHTSLAALVHDLLSRRVGKLRNLLDERQDDITDPAGYPEVVALAERLRAVRDTSGTIWMPRMRGVEIAIKGILEGIGISRVSLGGTAPTGAERLEEGAVPSVGFALGVFKAAQLLEIGDIGSRFDNFTAIDLETTAKDVATAEVVEIAAVRVRNGEIVAELASLVKPKGHIPRESTAVHGIRDADVATASSFNDVWPKFRAFCGTDVVVAHNGYDFDFRVLNRLVREMGKTFDVTKFDSLPLARDLLATSRKLEHLAGHFGIETGRSHRALDDTRTLAQVLIRLDALKLARARKTALVNLLDFLGIALSLSDAESLTPEGVMFRDLCRVFTLGRHSSCLDIFDREVAGDESLPTSEEIVHAFGGPEIMRRIRAEKSPDERFPVAMIRLRRLIERIPEGPLSAQISAFLERVVLSAWEGHEVDDARVNLLTLHSTKGLEFSRVYVVGVEDTQLPGGSPRSGPTTEEIEEARRLLYVGMTRTIDRLVLTRVETRAGKPTLGHRFLDEMGLTSAPTPELVS